MSGISIQPEPEFAAFIGIDWADQKHIWCLQTAGSAKRETGELEHSPEAIESWVAHLYQRFAQRPIAVAVEQSRGALVFMLSKYEPLHLFPVPPQMASSMRQALYPSGAKDDPRDADLLLDLLLQHRNKLRRLSPDSEATRRVQNLVEERRKLVDEKTAQINRLTDHLKAYFPQMLEWFGRLDSDVVCALLERWPPQMIARIESGVIALQARMWTRARACLGRRDRRPLGKVRGDWVSNHRSTHITS